MLKQYALLALFGAFWSTANLNATHHKDMELFLPELRTLIAPSIQEAKNRSWRTPLIGLVTKNEFVDDFSILTIAVIALKKVAGKVIIVEHDSTVLFADVVEEYIDALESLTNAYKNGSSFTQKASAGWFSAAVWENETPSLKQKELGARVLMLLRQYSYFN